ncbi:hypothetical protein ROZALSC1DRAFT_27217 [Rozella allomycis CSF55]|uniref:SWR1-complex protein 4 n=1 Tax=Rozella allomycis (strain CSF55) TaxID=988480 RepID=A0A075B0D2_ROZAC|nr:SWR1-complex protein 4/DNA methyltransferase 1 domain-containing protein [Rozella allomycis CSF55]RKP21373.1 hypothetical protein ROZALSC1DRAFT_27217 [Rozella allomycis CSF55]|eukprot:EPZ34414.1 SWR1-complex protein 4/DNA methyltransferase 1 domain-containing protein [Rozella allomycis CSF55]
MDDWSDQFQAEPLSLHFTDNEYMTYLADAEWSKDETLYFMDLCERFDLRWFVIHDRYDFEGIKRPIEDLKDRYISIQKKMTRIRQFSSDSNLNKQFDFNKNKEIERKRQLETLQYRSQEQLEYEEFLIIESKKVKQMKSQLEEERELLLKLLCGTVDQFGNLVSPITMLHRPLNGTGSDLKSIDNLNVDLVDGYRKERMAGLYLRGQRLLPIKSTLIRQVEKTLTDYGIPLKPKVPTKKVCEIFEELRSNVCTLVELRKSLEKIENEMKINKSGNPPTPLHKISDSRRKSRLMDN